MSIVIYRDALEGWNYYVCLPESCLLEDRRCPVAYVQDGDRFLPVLEDMLTTGKIKEFKHIIVGITPQNRLNDYTPWPSPGLDGMQAFGGAGDMYLQFLADCLKPRIDALYPALPGPSDTSIIGASLGGLISLYALYRQNCFGHIVSISGSMWYPGFVNFMQNSVPCRSHTQVLLLSGRMESSGVPLPLRNSVKCLQQAHLILKKQLPLYDIPLLWDNGSHADGLVPRFEKALQWIHKNDAFSEK